VRLAIHTKPGVLGVHLMHNLVPLCSPLANIETMEQLVCLQGLCDCELGHGLELLLDVGELYSFLILLKLCFTFLGLKEQFYLLPHFNNNLKDLSDILDGPLLLKEMLDGDDMNKVFLVVPLTKGGHLEVSPI
jgi:hypothetical protein